MERKWYWEIWEEGKYLDFWTINHVIAGVICAALAIFLNFPFIPALFFSFLGFIAWEMFEHSKKIEEHFSNKVADVLTSLAGFLLAYYLMFENPSNQLLILWISVALYTVLGVWGFAAFIQRKKSYEVTIENSEQRNSIGENFRIFEQPQSPYFVIYQTEEE